MAILWLCGITLLEIDGDNMDTILVSELIRVIKKPEQILGYKCTIKLHFIITKTDQRLNKEY